MLCYGCFRLVLLVFVLVSYSKSFLTFALFSVWFLCYSSIIKIFVLPVRQVEPVRGEAVGAEPDVPRPVPPLEHASGRAARGPHLVGRHLDVEDGVAAEYKSPLAADATVGLDLEEEGPFQC
jgi:hypothetical protein